MRILVISDTHIPVTTPKFPDAIIEEAKKSDCCIHAGDFISLEALETLQSLVKTYAVSGNMDNADVRMKLTEKKVIELESVRIGLIHGRGSPTNLIDSYIKKEFLEDLKKLDMVIFGHTHYPLDKIIEEKIYFNPGSSTDTVFSPYRSYGILEIDGKTIKRRIIKLG